MYRTNHVHCFLCLYFTNDALIYKEGMLLQDFTRHVTSRRRQGDSAVSRKNLVTYCNKRCGFNDDRKVLRETVVAL